MKRSKLKLVLGLIIIAVILVPTYVSYNRVNKLKNEIVNNSLSVCESYGLKDIKVIINHSEYKDYYSITIDSSNFEDLSFEEMYSINETISDLDNVFLPHFTSNNNHYNVYPSSRSIRKNGETIHDDYYNSESYHSAESNKGSLDNNEITVNDDAELATCWSLAIDVVKANLKSPSSAKFPFSYSNSDVSITKSGNTYFVRSWVEAENSFGAKLRSNFTVTMEKSGSGKNTKFTSISCDID